MAQFIFGFVGKYNAYVDPMLYLTGVDELVTLQLAIENLNTLFKGYSEVICAVAIIGILPLESNLYREHPDWAIATKKTTRWDSLFLFLC